MSVSIIYYTILYTIIIFIMSHVGFVVLSWFHTLTAAQFDSVITKSRSVQYVWFEVYYLSIKILKKTSSVIKIADWLSLVETFCDKKKTAKATV